MHWVETCGQHFGYQAASIWVASCGTREVWVKTTAQWQKLLWPLQPALTVLLLAGIASVQLWVRTLVVCRNGWGWFAFSYKSGSGMRDIYEIDYTAQLLGRAAAPA